MGLLAKLLKSLESHNPTISKQAIRRELSELTKENRLHVRYNLPISLGTTLKLPNQKTAHVLNISYGGVGAESNDVATHTPSPDPITVEISTLGLHFTCQMSLVRTVQRESNKPFLGLAFCHDSADTLRILRPFIDSLRMGQSLALVPVHLRREIYKVPSWHSFRGEGPTDLLIQVTGQTPEQALLTFPWEGTYGELVLYQGKISTRESLPSSFSGDHRLSSQMQTTSILHQGILRRGLWILASTPKEIQTLTSSLFQVSSAYLTHHENPT